MTRHDARHVRTWEGPAHRIPTSRGGPSPAEGMDPHLARRPRLDPGSDGLPSRPSIVAGGVGPPSRQMGGPLRGGSDPPPEVTFHPILPRSHEIGAGVGPSPLGVPPGSPAGGAGWVSPRLGVDVVDGAAGAEISPMASLCWMMGARRGPARHRGPAAISVGTEALHAPGLVGRSRGLAEDRARARLLSAPRRRPRATSASASPGRMWRGRDETVRLWDVAAAQALRALEGHTNLAGGVAFSQDGKTLASGTYLWDVATARALRSYKG